MKNFTVVVPTYSGVSTIHKTFKSILSQNPIETTYEVVVIIDGPNKDLEKVVKDNSSVFKSKNISFSIKAFPNNKGRFEARIAGANLAKFDQLLFVDDRVHLDKSYFQILESFDEDIAMANVVEVDVKKASVISRTLSIIRRRLYKGKFGYNTADYYINSSNFETSPKGTTSLWINKGIFLNACDNVRKQDKNSTKYFNEDTKILRAVVDEGFKIFRPGKLIAYYQARSDLKSSIKHLYERGPRFVDYYSRPGTRFFPLLALSIIFPIGIILILTLAPQLLPWTILTILILYLLAAITISRSFMEIITVSFGLPLIGLVFSLGVYKGILIKAMHSLRK